MLDNDHYEKLTKQFASLKYTRDLSDCSEQSDDNNSNFYPTREVQKRYEQKKKLTSDMM